MLFNTADFMVFLLIVVLIYYICPQKIRNYWLLLASWYFYMQWNPVFILLLLGVTVVTYFAGLEMERCRNKSESRTEKRILVLCLVLTLGVLAFFKYFSFFMGHLDKILRVMHLPVLTFEVDIPLPVGISFFTLQSIGYVIDVYRKDVYAEKNFFKYSLFIAFFPQLVAGPIERSRNLLVQINEPKRFSYENLVKGIYLILWGLFLKMVIADRVAIVVDTVYENPSVYQGMYIVFATILFAFQIYCDFYGYTTIARGAAVILGFRLVDNFNAPYFSCSVKEFWRRWHISLSGWFRDYLYIPLGGNRRGELRKEGNLLLVFGISGLWHGAALGYVFWGVLNGVYQVIADVREKIHRKISGVRNPGNVVFSARMLKRVSTFLLVTFAWLFFRAGGVDESIELLRNLREFNWYIFFDGSVYQLGVEREYMLAVYGAILLLMLVDYQKYKGKDVLDVILRQGWWFRVLCVNGLLRMIWDWT